MNTVNKLKKYLQHNDKRYAIVKMFSFKYSAYYIVPQIHR